MLDLKNSFFLSFPFASERLVKISLPMKTISFWYSSVLVTALTVSNFQHYFLSKNPILAFTVIIISSFPSSEKLIEICFAEILSICVEMAAQCSKILSFFFLAICLFYLKWEKPGSSNQISFGFPTFKAFWVMIQGYLWLGFTLSFLSLVSY